MLLWLSPAAGAGAGAGGGGVAAGGEHAAAVEDLEDAGHAAHLAVQPRHVVGEGGAEHRSPRRRHRSVNSG